MRKVVILAVLLISILYILPIRSYLLDSSEQNIAKEHMVSRVQKTEEAQDKIEQNSTKYTSDGASEEQTSQNETKTTEETHTITVSVDGKAEKMKLEDYVAGVTAAEMPASFPLESLKAQAIAARTFAAARQEQEKDSTHPDADVCNDYTHCAAYLDLDTESQKQWGSRAEEWRAKIEQAVAETAGKIITYQDEPITAVFHAACGEETESAEDVWGAVVPYLVSVDSSGDSACPDYTASVTFAAEDFRQRMLSQYPKINLTGRPDSWFTKWKRADAGNVLWCRVGGVKAKGTALRQLLGLRSTNFTVSTTETSITFETTGYGHGVGMSQYGAKAMAENGSSCEEILTHYYTDTKIQTMDS